MNIIDRYTQVENGEFSKENFLLEARQDSRINKTFSHLNSYDEVVGIFKQRGFIPVEQSSEKEFSFKSFLQESIEDMNLPDQMAIDISLVNPFEYEKGWKHEMQGKNMRDDKLVIAAQKKAVKNLNKDPLYYTKIQMGKHAPTAKQVEEKKMLDISKGKNYTDPHNQVKPVKIVKPEPKEDEERVMIEKLKTKLHESLKKKILAKSK